MIRTLGNPAVSRDIKAEIMRFKQLTTRQTRIKLRWAGFRNLCNLRTAKWRGLTEEAQICPMCRNRVRNVSHIQTYCTHLHDACIKAHNDCCAGRPNGPSFWNKVYAEQRQYETSKQTYLYKIPAAKAPPQHKRRRLDGIAILEHDTRQGDTP